MILIKLGNIETVLIGINCQDMNEQKTNTHPFIKACMTVYPRAYINFKLYVNIFMASPEKRAHLK